jgi:predicted nucleic acid-binding protein
MIVVADTSPLNYLIRLGRPDVLREIYGRVLVPHAVLMEMQHPEAPAEVRAWASAAPAWLEAMQVRQLDASLAAELGAGEREAISLALEVHADVLLIDERAGRREAEVRHLEVAGTLAVLLQASLRGYFDLAGNSFSGRGNVMVPERINSMPSLSSRITCMAAFMSYP